MFFCKRGFSRNHIGCNIAIRCNTIQYNTIRSRAVVKIPRDWKNVLWPRGLNPCTTRSDLVVCVHYETAVSYRRTLFCWPKANQLDLAARQRLHTQLAEGVWAMSESEATNAPAAVAATAAPTAIHMLWIGRRSCVKNHLHDRMRRVSGEIVSYTRELCIGFTCWLLWSSHLNLFCIWALFYYWIRRRCAHYCFSTRLSCQMRWVLATGLNAEERKCHGGRFSNWWNACVNVFKCQESWENGIAGWCVLCICTNPGIMVLSCWGKSWHFTVLHHEWRHFDRTWWSIVLLHHGLQLSQQDPHSVRSESHDMERGRIAIAILNWNPYVSCSP